MACADVSYGHVTRRNSVPWPWHVCIADTRRSYGDHPPEDNHAALMNGVHDDRVTSGGGGLQGAGGAAMEDNSGPDRVPAR